MIPKNQAPETRPSLILRLRDPDDMVAWQEFVEVYQPMIHALAMRKGLQKADADDVTQEVLTSVANHIESWKSRTGPGTSFRAWLATITRNQTFLFFRKRAQQPNTGNDSQLGRIPDELDQSDFDLEHERHLFEWASRRIQSRFEPKTWQAFWLTAVKENNVADVAENLRMSVGQVYVARSRVMSALKQAVELTEFESRVDWRVS